MSFNLCIDWGNTLVKAGLFQNGQLVSTHAYAPADAQIKIIDLVEEHKPAYAILSSVTTRSSELEALITSRVKRLVIMTERTHTPIMNAYSSDTVGVDRLAMAVGAWHEYPGKNNLVICLGTCITYNFVQNNKTFRGGAISPGLNMRLKAMHEFTDQLPSVDMNGEVLLLGYDTETCMRSGAVYGIQSEIEGMVKAFSAQYADFNAVLTGGDMSYFAGKLKCEIFADPDIILKGLNIILKHNVPQAV